MIECIKIKADKCIACRRCEVACIAAHHNMTFKEAMKHRDVLVARVQVIKTHEMKTSVRCHQCEHAPCCNVCPTGALKQMESGVIDFHEELCIACEMCIKACPYGTIQLDAPAHCNLQQEEAENSAPPLDPPHCREVAVRCDMCREWRGHEGKKITACMEVCPVQALYLLEPDGNVIEMPKPQKKAVEKKPEAKKE
ncbi:MAG: 4Fe-4S binding protein [Desulfovibrio sp.]